VATILLIFLRINWTNFVVFHPAGWTTRIFQWRVTQNTSNLGHRENPGQDAEIKDCPGKSRTDGHFTFVANFTQIGPLLYEL